MCCTYSRPLSHAYIGKNSGRRMQNSFKTADVGVGFQSLQFFTRENVSTKATVCTQIDSGSLEREIVVFLNTIAEGTAEGN